MEAQDIKNYIYENNRIEYILEELNMHHIKWHDGNRYITCGFPDGDNTKSCVIYCDNEYYNVDAYTRNIEDKFGNSDLISLICFVKNMYFTESLKWICDVLGLDYYKDTDEEIPDSLKLTKLLLEMNNTGDCEIENEKLKPINEKILNYYYPYVNKMFKKDGISYEVQRMFEVGYDLQTNRITIPIRDELGTLVGVKGRLYKENVNEDECKYLYIEPCAKNKILYGLHITMPYIKKLKKVIVVESEKGVQQLISNDIFNVVAIGGHKLSKQQIIKLIRLGVEEVIFAYDQDVGRKEDGSIDMNFYKKEAETFVDGIKISALIDIKNNLLIEKESPCDNIDKFKQLYDNRIVLRSELCEFR